MQAQMASFNKANTAAATTATAKQMALAQAMATGLNRSGQWQAGIRNMTTGVARMQTQFDKGATSFRQYRQNSKMWSKDHTAINNLAADRVRRLQTQYMALGKEVNGVQKTMAMKPTGVVKQWGGEAMLATQRAVLFRRNLEMGANSMINWGKNTQWAGRQMMVGMGIPIALAAAGAVSSFKDIEAASISFKRVYGDATTSAGEKAQMLGVIQEGVAKDMTKYGIAVADTIDIAAKAAATGQQGENLVAATRETMRLATLGQMDYQTALESTIATQTAFGVNAQDMTRVTDFLNAAENQTILTMSDMAKAIPRVAPVIKGLGGDVEDLGVLMTALRSGGVTAEQGANALKSGLASLINPTSTATAAMKEFGIPLDKITKANKGDLIGTVKAFAKALDDLGTGKEANYKRQQALEALFGKYQYARMGALFRNINKQQARETEKLSRASNASLAKMSESEMNQIAESSLTKFQAAIENLKAAAAPLGKMVLDVLTPMINGFAKVADFFAGNDVARNILFFGAALAGLVGVGTMLTGVFANFIGTMTKFGMKAHSLGRRLIGRPMVPYQTGAQLDAIAAEKTLTGTAKLTTAALYAESGAVKTLAMALNNMANEANQAAAANSRLATQKRIVPTGVKPTGVKPNMQPVPMGTETYSATTGDRAHFGLPGVLAPTDPRYKAIKAYYEKQNLKPTSDRGRLLAYMRTNQPLTTLNAAALLQDKNLNNIMGQKGGQVPAAELLKDVQSKRGNLVAPLFQQLAIASGAKTSAQQAAFAARKEVRTAAAGITNAYTAAMAKEAAAGRSINAARFEEITKPIVDEHARAMGSNYTKAWEKVNAPAFVAVPGDERVPVPSQKVKTDLPLGPSWGKTGDIKATIANMGFGSLEGLVQAAGAATGALNQLAASASSAATSQKNYAKLNEGSVTTTAALRSQVAGVAAQSAYEAKNATTAAVKVSETATKQERAINSRMAKMADQSQWTKGFKGKDFAAGLMPTREPGIFRRGGAFTFDHNAWSNKLFGLGMAADFVTMGLMATGKDIPAWSHMIGMGMMTLGMFPGLIAKPAGMVGSLLKSTVLPPVRTLGSKLKTFGAVAAVAASEFMGFGKRGEFFAGLGKLGIVGAAIAAVAGGALFLKHSQDQLIQRSRDLAKTYGLSSDIVNAWAGEVGKETVTMRHQRQVMEYATEQQMTQADVAKVNAKLQTQAGQAIIAQVNAAKELGGTIAGKQSLATQIATLYGEGLVGRKEAIQIGVQIANVTGMENQVFPVTALIKELTGKGIDTPIEVKAKIGELITGDEAVGNIIAQSEADRSWWDTLSGWTMNLPGGFDYSKDEYLNAKAITAAWQESAFQGQMTVGQIYSNLDRLFGYNQNLVSDVFGEFSSEIDSVFTERGYLRQGRDLTKARLDALDTGDTILGNKALKLQVISGNLSPDSLDALLTGNADLNKNVALNFSGADTKSAALMSQLLGDETASDATKNRFREGLQTGVFDAGQLKAFGNRIEAFNKLPSGKKSLAIDITTTGVDQINQLKGAAKEFSELPPNVQKQFSVTVTGKDEAESLTRVMDKVNDYSPKDINLGIKNAEGIQGQVDLLSEAKSLQIWLKNNATPVGDRTPKAKDVQLPKGAKAQDVTINYKKGKMPKLDKTKEVTLNYKKGKMPKLDKTKTVTLNYKKGKMPKLDKTKTVTINYKKGKMPELDRTKTVTINFVKGTMPVVKKVVEAAVNYKLGHQDKPEEKSANVNYQLGKQAAPASPKPATVNYSKGTQEAPSNMTAIVRYVKGGATGGLFLAGGGISKRNKFNGKVFGPGGPEADKIPAWLSNGEYVIRQKAVKKYGTGLLDIINEMRLAEGGIAGYRRGDRVKDKDKDKDKDKGSGKEKWKWSDVLKEINSRALAALRSVKLIADMGSGQKMLAVIEQLGDDPKALKRFRDMNKHKRKKLKNKIFHAQQREERIARAQEWQDFLEEQKDTQKFNSIRLKFNEKRKQLFRKRKDRRAFKGYNDNVILGMDDIEIEHVNELMQKAAAAKKKMNSRKKAVRKEAKKDYARYQRQINAYMKGEGKRYRQQQRLDAMQEEADLREGMRDEVRNRRKMRDPNSTQFKAALQTRKFSLADEVAFNRRYGAGGKKAMSGLNLSAQANLSQEDYQMLQTLSGKALQDFKTSLNNAATSADAAAESLRRVEVGREAKQSMADVGYGFEQFQAWQGVGGDYLANLIQITGVAWKDVGVAIFSGGWSEMQMAVTAFRQKVLEYASMTMVARRQEAKSLNDSLLQSYKDEASAMVERRIVGNTGMSRALHEATVAVWQTDVDNLSHANELRSREINDINKAYDEQAKILDKVEQHQQAIANIERGRISLANALTTGDIAAAALAAQELQVTTAQFAREQMRQQLSDEKEAKVKVLQDQIDNVQKYIDAINDKIWQSQYDISKIQAQSLFWDQMQNEELERKNILLASSARYWNAIRSDIESSRRALFAADPKLFAELYSIASTGYSTGGWVGGYGNKDTVPVRLTPGEFVVNKLSAAKFGGVLESLNSPSYRMANGTATLNPVGTSGNIYNVTVNASTNANAEEIASVAVRQIKSLESSAIRSRNI